MPEPTGSGGGTTGAGAAGPGTAEAGAAGADTAGAGTAEARAAEPGTAGPGTAGPGAAEPGAAGAGAGGAGAAGAGAGGAGVVGASVPAGLPADVAGAAPATVEIRPVPGLPELRPGDDLAGLLAAAAPWLRDGDIVVVTSKAVSKVEGRLLAVPPDPVGRELARQAAITAETVRVVASRGRTRIAQTRHGIVLASAGVDASNVRRDELALLPLDPDASAARLRAQLRGRLGIEVAVVVSDTIGRPWRIGLTDIAIGVAGMAALVDLRGAVDRHGNELELTEVAVADEVAAAADLGKGKLASVPAAVVRGLSTVDDKRGARAMVRRAEEDLFSLGTAEALAAGRAGLLATLTDPRPGPAEVPADLVAAATPPGTECRFVPVPATLGARVRAAVDAPAAVPSPTLVLVCLPGDAAPPAYLRTGTAIERFRTALAVDSVGSAILGDTPADPEGLAADLDLPAGWRAVAALALGAPTP
jgi:coenzyme F420-0:L-glutamate ligase / coenzyme F420-1:gamma-L-glutamate ligase